MSKKEIHMNAWVSKRIALLWYYMWRWKISERNLAECKNKNQQIDWLDFIYNTRLKKKEKEVYRNPETNKQINWLRFIYSIEVCKESKTRLYDDV